jgi:signal transduction histidine kinase
MLFRDHLDAQYEAELVIQLDGLTAALALDAAGKPVLRALPGDPRFKAPYGGRYWQVEWPGATGLRSRSLWDQALPLAADRLAPGDLHRHEVAVPGIGRVRVVERVVRFEEAPDQPIRVAVAMPVAEIAAVAGRFDRLLAITLALLAMGLVAASAIQVAVGLAPLARLGRALAGVRSGTARRLEGDFPQEVAALVDELNALLTQQEHTLERARGQAADLAHALKTSLQLLLLEADRLLPGDGAHARTIREQATRMQAVIDRHLARARLQGRPRAPGPGVELESCARSLARVLTPMAAARAVAIECAVEPGQRYAGDRADLEEILGNLLDNACKWARSRVRLSGGAREGMLRLLIEDDGPGLGEADRDRAFARGRRLDETVQGSGLGLAIARDLAEACGGWITLTRASTGGLAATVCLPGDQPVNRSTIVL